MLNFFVVSFFLQLTQFVLARENYRRREAIWFHIDRFISTIVLRNSIPGSANIRREIFVMTSHSFNAQRKWPAIYADHRYFPASSTGHLRHILFRTKVTQNLYYVCGDKRHVARTKDWGQVQCVDLMPLQCNGFDFNVSWCNIVVCIYKCMIV